MADTKVIVTKTKDVVERLEESFKKDLAEKLGEVLKEYGIGNVTVTGISVDMPKTQIMRAGESPRPTKCRVRPDGSIVCKPEC